MCWGPQATLGVGGFGIRFTVQFNLFAGSLVGLAGAAQLRMLPEIQARGQLGCFLLTEMQAGMLLGLRRAAGHRHTVVLLTIGPTACGPTTERTHCMTHQ